MPSFIVNRLPQWTGENEVHDLDSQLGCLPYRVDRVYLGDHVSCLGAVDQARELGYAHADGCAECAPDCHVAPG